VEWDLREQTLSMMATVILGENIAICGVEGDNSGLNFCSRPYVGQSSPLSPISR
jgi:hypothetical protein